jgi:hypothetical protein
MQRTAAWTVPDDQVDVDSDFGGWPTLFKGSVSGRVTHLVAACNKNGVLYAWRANDLASGPLWQVDIDTGVLSNCSEAPIYDGNALYQGGAETTINGTTFEGSSGNSIRRAAASFGRRGFGPAPRTAST